MAHLTSRHTLTINLSNNAPSTDVVYTQLHAIQGPTDVKFIVEDVDLGDGISSFILDYGDGESVASISPTFSTTNTLTALPVSALEHTYYQSSATASTLTATAVIKYFSESGGKPLSAAHNIIIYQTPVNMIEKNIEVLNNQLFTVAGSAVPLFNLESDENIVYPCSFIEVEAPVFFDDGIYLNTDPENINLSEMYLYNTKIDLLAPLETYGLSALSGTGFTLQGKSGNHYTVAFAVTGDDLRYTYTQNTTSILLSTNFDAAPSIETLQNTITALFDENNLIGTEFSSITRPLSSVVFYQSNLMPPEATLYTYTTSTTSASSSYTALSAEDRTYSYVNNPHGESGLLGLSAVNRMKTDPDALLIRAL